MPKNLKVLAIDPSSTNTGWCVWDGREAVIWSGGYDKKAIFGERVGMFSKDVIAALNDHQPDVVAYEEPSSRLLSHAARKILFGMAAVVEATAYVGGYPTLPVNNETIKTHAGVKRSAGRRTKLTSQQKEADRSARLAALLQAARMFGFKVANDDEASACILADYVLRSAVIGEGRAA